MLTFKRHDLTVKILMFMSWVKPLFCIEKDLKGFHKTGTFNLGSRAKKILQSFSPRYDKFLLTS